MKEYQIFQQWESRRLNISLSVGLKDEELGKEGMAQKKLGTSLVGQVSQKGQRQIEE